MIYRTKEGKVFLTGDIGYHLEAKLDETGAVVFSEVWALPAYVKNKMKAILKRIEKEDN